MISVAIIEDDTDVREGIREYLSSQPGFLCQLAEDSIENFLENLDPDYPLDIILIDIGLPGMSGIDGVRIIKEKLPDTDVIMLTVYNDPHKIFQSLCAGASGYLLKNLPFQEIKQAIEILNAGGAPMTPQIARKVIEYFQPEKTSKSKSPLTEKEKEIVIGLVDGLSYKMIADRMNISIETVRTHLKHIYTKLHVHCKAEVITKSLRGEI